MVRSGPILAGADDRNRQIIERSIWRLIAGARQAVEEVLGDVRLVVERLCTDPLLSATLSESDVCVLLVSATARGRRLHYACSGMRRAEK